MITVVVVDSMSMNKMKVVKFMCLNVVELNECICREEDLANSRNSSGKSCRDEIGQNAVAHERRKGRRKRGQLLLANLEANGRVITPNRQPKRNRQQTRL